MWVLRDAVVKRRQDASDRTRIHAAVGMAADSAINGASVQASAATNTLETFAKWRSEYLGSAVVENDQVELLRSILLARTACSRDNRRVYRQRLTCGCPCQKLQENRKVSE